jgi:hypothetical protein
MAPGLGLTFGRVFGVFLKQIFWNTWGNYVVINYLESYYLDE